MHTGIVHAVDDTSLTANAGHDAAVVEERHEVACARLGLQQVVVPTDILLGERRIETLGRVLDAIDAIPDQVVTDECLVEFLLVGNQRRPILRIVLGIGDDLALVTSEEPSIQRAGDRNAQAHLAASHLRTVEGRGGLVVDAVIGVDASRNLHAHEARFGEREIEGTAGLRRADGGTQVLATPEEIALGERHFTQNTVDRRITGSRTIFTGRGLGHIDVEHDLVGRRSRSGGNFHLREEAKRFDLTATTDNHGAVERVAFAEFEFPTNDKVTRLGIAGDIDAFDIDASAFIHEVGDVERAGRDITIQTSADVSEGITLSRGFVSHVFQRLLQIGNRVTTTLPGLDRALEHIGIETVDAGFDIDVAEFVGLAFIYREIDEVGIARGIILGNRVDLRIGIAAIGVVETDTLAINRQLLLVIGIVAEQPAENASFLGEHGALEAAGTNRVIASEVDRRNACALALIDLENHSHATIGSCLGPRRHTDGHEAIAVVSLTNAFDISSQSLLREHSGRTQIDHCQQLLVGEATIALEQDRTDQLLLSVGTYDTENRHTACDQGCSPHKGNRGNRSTHQLGGVDHIVIAFCDLPRESRTHRSPKPTPLKCFTVFLTRDKAFIPTRLVIHWRSGIRATPCEPRLMAGYRRIPKYENTVSLNTVNTISARTRAKPKRYPISCTRMLSGRPRTASTR